MHQIYLQKHAQNINIPIMHKKYLKKHAQKNNITQQSK